MKTNTQQPREYWIDIMRTFACIMVLFCHSPQPYSNQPGQILLGINNYYGMAWGPILFFMISGACILGKEQHAIPFLRRRFSRILFPTIIWSTVYIFMECFVWETAPSSEATYKFLLIPFGPQYSLMWFMYALTAIYLLAPIISPWLLKCTKKEIELYLGLWGITLFLPYLGLYNHYVYQIISSNGILFYLSGFLWVAVLGYYCRFYVERINISFWKIIVCIFILLSPLNIFMIKKTTGITISSSLSIDSIATTMLAVLFIKNISWRNRFQKLIALIAKYSFGIYLSHMLFMYPFRLWIAQYNFHYAIQIPLTAFIVGISALFLCCLSSKLRFSKYIIG